LTIFSNTNIKMLLYILVVSI